MVIESVELSFECDRDLEHCHGTAIVHFGGAWECVDDPDCAMAAELHLFGL